MGILFPRLLRPTTRNSAAYSVRGSSKSTGATTPADDAQLSRLPRPATEQVRQRDYFGRRRATQPSTPSGDRASAPARLPRPTTHNSDAYPVRRPSKSASATTSADDAQLSRQFLPRRPWSPWSVVCGLWSVVRGPCGPWSVVRSLWSVVCGLWSVVPVVRGP